MKARQFPILAIVAVLMAAPGVLIAQSPVGTAFTYQGQLKHNNAPIQGTTDFKFSLWDADAGPNQVGSTLVFDGQGGNPAPVNVVKGLLTATLDFGQDPFATDARWLEIAVRSPHDPNDAGPYSTLSPRQELTPTPYALYALSGPGGGACLWQESGSDIYYDGGNVGIGTLAPGAELDVNGLARIQGSNWPSDGMGMELGYSDVDHTGYIQVYDRDTSTWGDLFLGGNVGFGTTDPAEKMHVYSGSGVNVRIGGNSNNDDAALQLFGNSIAGSEDGIALEYDGDYLSFRKWNSGVSDSTLMKMGGYFGRVGIGGDHTPLAPLHVEGIARMTGLQVTDSAQPGYVLTCTNTYGVAGWQPPGAFTLPYTGSVAANGDIAMDITNSGSGTDTVAVRGYASAASGTNYGVVGISNSPDGYAGWFTGNTTINPPGSGQIEFRGDGGTPAINIDGGGGTLRVRRALQIWPDDSGTAAGYFDVRDPNGAIQIALNGADGRVTTNILEITGADLAEKFPVTDPVEPGTVVEIDPDNAGQLRLARGAYNRLVAGVVSGANDLPAGVIMGNLPGHDDAPPIALSGRVWTYCDASNGAIQPGDLLTTSDTPGHAMRVTDYPKAQGAIIGKAMSGLERGETGLVLVLVSLQ